jgi:hypothetical protein
MLRPLVPALLGLVFLVGCSSAPLREQDRTNWYLVGVDLDREAAPNAGVMPVFRRPAGTNFAGAPVASGSLKLGDTGKAVCVVRFDEPVVGLSGRQAMQRYEVVNFNGQRAEDGARILGRFGAGFEAPLGVPTELRLERVSELRLVVRPYSGAKPLPYRFTFAADAAVERPVEIPFVD